MSSLTISAPSDPNRPSFRWTGTLALPVAVESAGLVLPDGDGFRVWINRPGETLAAQFRASRASGIREMAAVPVTVAAGSPCSSEFLLTGADAAGSPVAVAVSTGGGVAWRQSIPSANPFRWPVPGCASRPLVVWQDEPGLVRSCEISAARVHPLEPFAAGGPPLDIAIAGGSIWCVWSDSSGVLVAESGAKGVRRFTLSAAYSSEVAIGESGSAVAVAWMEQETAFLASIAPGAGPPPDHGTLDLGAARGGSLAFIPASVPLLAARSSVATEGELFEPLSVLTAPGLAPVEIAGLIHSVACNGSVVALLGSSRLYFLTAPGLP